MPVIDWPLLKMDLILQLQALTSVRTDIMKSLSLYYYTFVDLLDLKDHISELLTIMDALGMSESLDIVSIYMIFFH